MLDEYCSIPLLPCGRRGVEGVARFELATDPGFQDAFVTEWIQAVPQNDFIVKQKVDGLDPGTRYYYRLLYGEDTDTIDTGPNCTFRTLDLENVEREVDFVAVTGMNYFVFHFFPGPPNKSLGYPALETIQGMGPDFFVGTGDNVYYDAFPTPAKKQNGLRDVWYKQFIQPRYVSLFSEVPTYWEKDDHDHRYNDSDTTGTKPPSNELGIQTFLEQLPVADPGDPDPITYRTHRINKLLQIWLTEGRDYRSPNAMEDGPDKTLWGETQKAWLQQTLLESDATFKLLISPTPMVGPDDTMLPWPYTGQPKRDNHTNPAGFRHEGDAFFSWLGANGFLDKNFYIICGDRHWKYHSIRPDGFEEFSTGALVDQNSRLGRVPGDPESTDPEGLIMQPYIDAEATGGFLRVHVRPGEGAGPASCEFTFYDENGVLLYTTTKLANEPD
jgi:alkaline phosphatase/alkaline phosphatase D